ncbi:MAG: pantoate--beta-alanine ligase [Deltaproteobacteria bacterium]|nr:pantoate--beta-alanine ligase [Deltaproteobacteria bacterium]
MEIIRDVQEMQRRCGDLRRQGKRIAFVPTMGYLHEGHLSLLREGRRQGDVLALSIFVNPIQFGAGEDFEAYPRDLERDCELARREGVDLVFNPKRDDLYPEGFATHVTVSGLTETLCGESRPGHFQGVTTVVCKLFNIIGPDVALFGRKDFQQLAVIQRMARDLDLAVEIRGMPIVREADGLAMSSRNVYLGPAERNQALALVDSLRLARRLVVSGARRAAAVLDAVEQRIRREPLAEIDYIRICHQETLQEMEEVTPDSVLLLAVRFGKTRLIDNHVLFEELNP